MNLNATKCSVTVVKRVDCVGKKKDKAQSVLAKRKTTAQSVGTAAQIIH